MIFEPIESLLDLIRNETTQQYFIAYLPAIHCIVILFHIPVPAPLIVVILTIYFSQSIFYNNKYSNKGVNATDT